jgi:hypothetical protein
MTATFLFAAFVVEKLLAAIVDTGLANLENMSKRVMTRDTVYKKNGDGEEDCKWRKRRGRARGVLVLLLVLEETANGRRKYESVVASEKSADRTERKKA